MPYNLPEISQNFVMAKDSASLYIIVSTLKLGTVNYDQRQERHENEAFYTVVNKPKGNTKLFYLKLTAQ